MLKYSSYMFQAVNSNETDDQSDTTNSNDVSNVLINGVVLPAPKLGSVMGVRYADQSPFGNWREC